VFTYIVRVGSWNCYVGCHMDAKEFGLEEGIPVHALIYTQWPS